MRDGFLLHEKTLRMMNHMSDLDGMLLISYLWSYSKGNELDWENIQEVSPIVAVALEDACERMDADIESYERQIKQKSEAGKKSAQKRWGNNESATESNEAVTESNGVITESNGAITASNGEVTENNHSVSVSVSDSVSDSVLKEKEKVSESKIPQPKRKRFEKPTVEEVRAYCLERNNNVDAETFVDFYDSKGWCVGKTPMKDWKASVRTWERSPHRNRGIPAYPMAANGEIDWSRV